MAALGVMTFISVAIGYVFKSLPDVVKSSLPLGQYLGAATMLYFGIKTLRVLALLLSQPDGPVLLWILLA